MAEPIVTLRGPQADANARMSASGRSFSMREWRGSGPALMHVHHDDDEGWHVLEGMLRFRFPDRIVEAPAGATVFVPAGVAHTLIAELQQTRDRAAHADIYRKHHSELLE
jgi:mannose-6-phosphate isomerase-like protein (cupin superfamily)